MNPLKISLVVVSYNMARELPRTIRSLSCCMQRGVDPAEYEVIVVDNGSEIPFDENLCRRWMPDMQILRIADPKPSPVPAINHGLAHARADLIGVMIDGARMASPGLLHHAMKAARLCDRPVVGTLAFHLGPDVQTNSIRNGYGQETEDALLASSGWEEDGYRLFDISVFAASSAHGWFALPAETNALFLTKTQWEELGGYDPGFVSPGGGLANLDIWKRACSDARSNVIMLLGEATFHQVHGGVATNAAFSPWELFHEEYVRLRGFDYCPPVAGTKFFGSIHSRMLPSLRASIANCADASSPSAES